jgi:hypothetical protein
MTRRQAAFRTRRSFSMTPPRACVVTPTSLVNLVFCLRCYS